MNDTSHTEITLESLQIQKLEALKALREQKKIMANTAQELFAPLAPAADKGTSVLRAFNTGMAIFDGVMTGIKLMRKIKKAFS